MVTISRSVPKRSGQGLKAAMAVMRFVLMTLAALLGLATPAAAELAGSGGPHIAASLVAASSQPAGGQRTTLALSMVPQPGWHGYWRTPGDTGYPMKIDWTLP